LNTFKYYPNPSSGPCQEKYEHVQKANLKIATDHAGLKNKKERVKPLDPRIKHALDLEGKRCWPGTANRIG
jgi:hypothetical protein